MEKLGANMAHDRNKASKQEILEADRKELFGQRCIYWGIKGKV
jgi:hypothetical protein